MNTLKFLLVLSLVLVSADFAYRALIDRAYGQAEQGPLRHEPQINEDEMIVCTKDVQHKAYFGQLSCIIMPMDDILTQKQAEKLYEKTQSLNDTFEMGLID